jgi:hypothetical protein
VSSTTPFTNQGTEAVGTAACPSGKVPISGGFNVTLSANIPQDWGVRESEPVFTRDGSGKITGGSWQVTLTSVNNEASSGSLTVTVVCASVS